MVQNEREKNISPPLLLLPTISADTIAEIISNDLKINLQALEEIIEKDHVNGTFGQVQLPIYNEHTGFTKGALLVYGLLTKEAEKQGKTLPKLSLEDIGEYYQDHPFLKHYQIPLGEAQGEKQISQAIANGLEELKKREYTPLTTDKYRSENPDLMGLLDKFYKKALGQMQANNSQEAIFLAGIGMGCLLAYECFRNTAEKERTRGLYS